MAPWNQRPLDFQPEKEVRGNITYHLSIFCQLDTFWKLYVDQSIQSLHQPCEAGFVITSVLQMRKLRLRNIE